MFFDILSEYGFKFSLDQSIVDDGIEWVTKFNTGEITGYSLALRHECCASSFNISIIRTNTAQINMPRTIPKTIPKKRFSPPSPVLLIIEVHTCLIMAIRMAIIIKELINIIALLRNGLVILLGIYLSNKKLKRCNTIKLMIHTPRENISAIAPLNKATIAEKSIMPKNIKS